MSIPPQQKTFFSSAAPTYLSLLFLETFLSILGIFW